MTSFGSSSTSATTSTTSSGRSSLPEKDSAEAGSSSLSWSIGVQMPSGQMQLMSMSLTPLERRSAIVLRLKPMTACFDAA